MRHLALGALLLCGATGLQAKDVEYNPALCNSNPFQTCQQAFDGVTQDLVATIDYPALGPAEATGLTGFGVGVVANYVPVGDEGDWAQLTGSEFDGIGMVGLQVTKGLPLDLDVGAFYSTVPGTNVDLYGAELRYAILPGSTTTPALAVRASYVAVTGIESFDLDSTSVDVSLSKGFGPVTPYVGVGYVMGEADPDASTGLRAAEVEEGKAFVGVRLAAGLFELTPQVGQVGEVTTFALRLGFSI